MSHGRADSRGVAVHLKNEPESFRTFIDSAAPRAIVADEGTFLGVNDAFCEGFKLPHRGIIGKHFSDLISQEDLARTISALVKVQSEDITGFSNSYVGGNQRIVHVIWNAKRVDDFGHIYCEVRFPKRRPSPAKKSLPIQ